MFRHNMHRMTTPALCLALLARQGESETAVESPPTEASYRTELERILAGGAVARNRGDLDAFMRDGTGACKIVHDHSS